MRSRRWKLTAPENTEVYNILCDSLHIEPKPNNGSLRLPLKPIGLHKPAGGVEEPADPVSSYTLPVATSTPTSGGASPTVGVDPVEVKTTTSRPITVNPAPPQPTDESEGSSGGDDQGAADGGEEGAKGLWGWFKDKLGEVWHKITGSG